jgi:hypothetical protein
VRTQESDPLDRPFLLSFEHARTLRSVLEDIRTKAGILILVDRSVFKGDEYQELLNLNFALTVREPMPVRAYLDAVADSLAWPVAFVPRQYGALLTKRTAPPAAEAGPGPR